ncbi:MAG: hypothetical protein NTY12_01740 [Candidatus Falkowbacteria bacterium]|nr:hypothetical protein [Candidatus Falkowbacteria bacterium]
MFEFLKTKSHEEKISDKSKNFEEKELEGQKKKYADHLDKDRKEYAQHVAEREKNPLFDVVTADDIVQNDAEVEDRARDLLNAGEMSEKDFDALINNSMALTTERADGKPLDGGFVGAPQGYPMYIDKIEGEIEGKQVLAKRLRVKMEPSEYKAIVNGEKLSDRDAEIIFNRYNKILELRDDNLYKLEDEAIEGERDALLEKEKRERNN